MPAAQLKPRPGSGPASAPGSTLPPAQEDFAAAEPAALARLAKALAHPARIQIVELLLQRTTCMGCELADTTGLAASTASEHLRILKEAGIIVGQIEHPRICYALNPRALAPLSAFLHRALLHRVQPVPSSAPSA